MDCISMLLLIALGGSCGGIASGIAQNNLNNSYKVRLPFLFEPNTKEARLLPLGILGNIIIGVAASTSIFFVAGPLFNLENTTNTTSISQEQRVVPMIFNPSEILNLPENQATDYVKIFSISVAAGFAGISLMEGMAQRVTDTVFSEEQRTSSDAVKLEEEAKPDGTFKRTLTASSQQEELNKVEKPASIDAIKSNENIEDTNDSSNTISAQESFKQLDSLDAEKLPQPLDNSTNGSAKVS